MRITMEENLNHFFVDGSCIPSPELFKSIDGSHNNTRYGCICGKRFALRRTYERHVLDKHRVKIYQCKLCTQNFSNRLVLKEHCERNHQEGRVPCRFCLKTFTTRSSLRLHHDAIHKGIRYACKQCSKSFGQLGSLRRHVNTIHNGTSEKLTTITNTSSNNTRKSSRGLISSDDNAMLERNKTKSPPKKNIGERTNMVQKTSKPIIKTQDCPKYPRDLAPQKTKHRNMTTSTSDENESNENVSNENASQNDINVDNKRNYIDYFQQGIVKRIKFDVLVSLGVDPKECDAIATLVSMKA